MLALPHHSEANPLERTHRSEMRNARKLGQGSRLDFDLTNRGATIATIAGTAYREGAIPLFELLDAQRVRADVRMAALHAATDLQMARLDLLRAIGLPVDSAQFLSPKQ